MMEHAIELSDVGYTAGDFKIEGLRLQVPRGSIYGFLGPNGSGKTTTIKLFLGMLKAKTGAIHVLGEPVPERIHHAMQSVGYVPERPHLYPTLTIDEAINFHRAFFPSWNSKRAQDLARIFRLPTNRKISRLSKGENGKLLMTLAIAQEPSLLVLDEPTDGLDPVVRRDVLAATLDYVSEQGATVFISSHLVHELERICDWVGVMDGGDLITQLPMQEFKNGIKKLRVVNPPVLTDDLPFTLLARERNGFKSGETWVVRGWQADMGMYLDARGAELADVTDLDLEDGFVELLRSARTERDDVLDV